MLSTSSSPCSVRMRRYTGSRATVASGIRRRARSDGIAPTHVRHSCTRSQSATTHGRGTVRGVTVRRSVTCDDPARCDASTVGADERCRWPLPRRWSRRPSRLSTLDRWLRRRRPHELAWTISLALFALGAGGAVVGRGARLEPGQLPALLPGRRGAERAVAGARHGLPAGRRARRRPRAAGGCVLLSGLSVGIVLFAPDATSRSPATSCRPARTSSVSRRASWPPSVGRRRAGDHRRRAVERAWRAASRRRPPALDAACARRTARAAPARRSATC